ncbi:hypothetical protein GF312_19845, partial [Candidatus Poribacteria bacterium]|nr:hypothetical protein [Candidatus Poribacteria bacterium]
MKTDRILYIIIILTIIPFPTFSNVDMEMQAGFGNYHKPGHWIFLRNILTNSGSKIDGELMVNTRESSVNARKNFTLPLVIPSYDIEIEDIYLKPEGFRHNLKVYLNNKDKEEIISREAALKVIPEDDILILVLGNDPDNLDFLTKTDTSNQENPDIHIVYSAFINDRISEILPGIWKGYDSVDVVIIGDVLLQEVSLNQQQALIDWVSAGGNLIISGGINSRNLMGEHIEKILPVKLNGETFLLDQDALQEAFDSESIMGQLILAESTPVTEARIIISDAKT